MDIGIQLLKSLCLFTLCPGLCFSQPAPTRAFEVASVLLSPPESTGLNSSVKTDGSRVDYFGIPLSLVLSQAFRLDGAENLIGPNWLSEVPVDIHATLPRGSSKSQVPEMLQALLSERFGLKYHHERKLAQVYSLKTIKGATLPTPTVDDGRPADCGGRGVYICHRASMGDFVKVLNVLRLRPIGGAFQELDKSVVDATGLDGKYDLTLNLGTGLNASPDSAGLSEGSSMRQALKELGLMLEPTTVEIDQIVIDHLARMPTAN